MKMIFLNHWSPKTHFICIALTILVSILKINYIKCQNQIFQPKNFTNVIVVVTEANEKGSNCDENASESNSSKKDAGNLKRSHLIITKITNHNNYDFILHILGFDDYKNMYAQAYSKQKLDIINWTLNRLGSKRIREIDSENSISSSFYPNDFKIEELEVCDSIEDTVTKMLDKIFHFKILPHPHQGLTCRIQKESEQNSEIFAGFVMLTKYGKEAERRISQVMPLKPKIPFYIPNSEPKFDHN